MTIQHAKSVHMYKHECTNSRDIFLLLRFSSHLLAKIIFGHDILLLFPVCFFFLCRKNTYFFSNIFLFFLFPFVSFLRDIEYDLPITPVILYHINFHMRNFLAQFGLVYAFLPLIECHCLSLLNVLKISQKWETFSNFFFKKASS